MVKKAFIIFWCHGWNLITAWTNFPQTPSKSDTSRQKAGCRPIFQNFSSNPSSLYNHYNVYVSSAFIPTEIFLPVNVWDFGL